jgi:hypothetical protein
MPSLLHRDPTRYVIAKRSDLDEYLTREEKVILARLLTKIYDCRQEAGKRELQAVVVEADWPEYEPVWEMIRARVAALGLGPDDPFKGPEL